MFDLPFIYVDLDRDTKAGYLAYDDSRNLPSYVSTYIHLGL
jgi:hypothetical protein